MVERGSNPAGVGEVVAESTNLLLEQNNKLGLSVIAALSSQEIGNMDEVLAALDLMERIASVSRSLLETRGDAIYKNGGRSQPSESGEVDSVVPAGFEPKEQPGITENVGPKTFGELLDSKIDNYFGDCEFVPKKVVQGLIGVVPTRRVAGELGIKPKNYKLKLEEAKIIVRKAVTKPQANFKFGGGFLDRQRMILSFFVGKGGSSLLDNYSEVIGYDWVKNPTVEYDTAMEIRGVRVLDNLIEKQNKALHAAPTGLD